MPAIVPPEALPRANARLSAVFYVGNMFVAPPVGAALFVVAAALPFGVNAVAFLTAAAMVLWLRHRPSPPPRTGRAGLRAEIADGVRWLWRHRLLRTLALCLAVMNVLFMAAFAIMVLYARERLGLGEVGFGLLLTSSAVGGLIGTAVVERLRARFGEAALLRVGLLVETATHIGLAMTDRVAVAVAIMVVFGVHAAVWGVLVMSVRQRVVPDDLRGRVGSVYYTLVVGGNVVGAPLGGVVAAWLGVAAPFWVSGVAMAVLTAVVWRGFRRSAFAEPPRPVPGGATG